MITILISLYIACEIIANVTAYKPITIGPITVPAAVFIYTLTFTLIDLINERLGKRGARQVVYGGFAANLLLAAYAQFAVALPPAPFFEDSAAFSRVLGSTSRIVVASLTAYIVSSLIDTEVFAWWRQRVGGYRWARVIASNSVSTLVDSILFITIAFAGILPLVPLISGQYIVKMGITVISVPLIYLVRSRRGEILEAEAGSLNGREQ